MATFTNTNKNSALSFSNVNKNSTTFLNLLKHTDQGLDTLANYTFQSVVFSDGTILENATFDQLTAVVFQNINKN